MMAVTNKGGSLKQLEKFKGDREVVMTAVKQNGMSLKLAIDDLKDDMEVVEAAVTQDGFSLD